MMQNHYVISSETYFLTRNVPNWTKIHPSVMSGLTLDSMHEETHKGKYMEHIEERYMEYIGDIYGISINIYAYSLYIPYIFYVFPQYVPHIFSHVCFFMHGVKSRSGHDRSQSFGQISHVSGPKLTF